MKHAEALSVASRLIEQLKPHCYRVSIAGSIRRQQPEVNDIEIVVVPKPYQTGLFADGVAKVMDNYPVVKGYFPCKYTRRILHQGICVDLFLVDHANWGLQLAIRTGPADYSHKVLATGWVRRGFHCEGGYLQKNGKAVGILEERDLFELIGIGYVPAHLRQ